MRQSLYHRTDVDIAAANVELAALNRDIALELKAEFVLGAAREFGIKVRKSASEETVIGYDARAGELFVDRRRSGNVAFSPSFAGVHRGPLALEQGKITLHIFVDTCSVEVFGNDGRAVISDLIFPDAQSTGGELYAVDGDVRVNAFDVWELE